MLLDGVMVLIATICMTVMHPGYAFGKRWNDASFPFRTHKRTSDEGGSQTAGARSSNTLAKRIPVLKSAFPSVFGDDRDEAIEYREEMVVEDHTGKCLLKVSEPHDT